MKNRKINLTAELAEHQHQAEKRIDKENSKADSSVRAFAYFDLQQCLPTPYLKTSVSFYKRQLCPFNLIIYDLATNEATCYMWNETIGARGAN
ncbi:unnamed protein product [Euphydryas editha]|uniref:Uncharacterized protein n=1 Tax=Euphydryas editha TaxID=104508 RepID=A0AAU9TRQ2_EUPED|nr:unnamed protein product [Euphydryas editha]